MILYRAKLIIEELEKLPENQLPDRNFSDFKNKLIASKRQATMKTNGNLKPQVNIIK